MIGLGHTEYQSMIDFDMQGLTLTCVGVKPNTDSLFPIENGVEMSRELTLIDNSSRGCEAAWAS